MKNSDIFKTHLLATLIFSPHLSLANTYQFPEFPVSSKIDLGAQYDPVKKEFGKVCVEGIREVKNVEAESESFSLVEGSKNDTDFPLGKSWISTVFVHRYSVQKFKETFKQDVQSELASCQDEFLYEKNLGFFIISTFTISYSDINARNKVHTVIKDSRSINELSEKLEKLSAVLKKKSTLSISTNREAGCETGFGEAVCAVGDRQERTENISLFESKLAEYKKQVSVPELNDEDLVVISFETKQVNKNKTKDEMNKMYQTQRKLFDRNWAAFSAMSESFMGEKMARSDILSLRRSLEMNNDVIEDNIKALERKETPRLSNIDMESLKKSEEVLSHGLKE